MPLAPADPAPGERAPYIRAGGGIDVQGRRVAALVALCGAVLLAALAVGLGVGAMHRNAQRDALRHTGVPVKVTVTGCLGISSGVGMGIEYWQCRGSYRLAGQTYNEVISGSRQLRERGQTVDGVVAPSHPSVVSSAAAVRTGSTAWTAWIAPAALGVAAGALVLGWLVLSGRLRARSRPPADA